MDTANTATLQDANWPSQPPCIVLNCGQAGQHLWTVSSAWRGWPAQWLVCEDHYSKLVADHDWQHVHGQAPTWNRWILMGDDIGKNSNQVDDQAPGPTSPWPL